MYVRVSIPVGLVVSVDSGEALAPSDGSGGEASDWANGQRHGGESSGWTPCIEQRRRTINSLQTQRHDRLIGHVFLSSVHLMKETLYSHLVLTHDLYLYPSFC